MRSFLTIVLKTLLYTVLVSLLLLGAVVIGLQIPTVQTQVVRYAAKKISAKLQFPVDVRRVAIKWFDTVTLEDVSIRNRDQKDMIDVGRIEVDLSIRNLVDSSRYYVQLDEVLLYQPNVRLVKDARTGELNFDAFLARINELLKTDTLRPIPNRNVPFLIQKATIIDGRFSYDDRRKPAMQQPKRVFDYNHFVLNGLNANLKNFLILGDTIAADVGRLKAYDKRADLRINRLDVNLLYSAQQLRLDELSASINGSIIRDKVIFDYKNFSDFGEFNRRVRMTVNLRDVSVRAQDLIPFTSYFNQNNDIARADGLFVGTVNDFKLTNADIRFGKRSRLVGDLAFKGLPDADRTTVDFRFRPSVVDLTDIKPYYSDPGFDPVARKLGLVGFNATFAGLFTNFRTAGTFSSALGLVKGNLDLKLAGPGGTTYRGDLSALNFDLGTLLDRSDIQKLDGQAQFSGRGLDVNTALLNLDGRFSRIGYNDYNYRNLVLRGNLQKSFFDGYVSVRDTNLTVNLDGEFDLRGPRRQFDVRGSVRRANLRALNFTRDTLVLSSDLDVSLVGNTVDDLIGQADFKNAYLTLGKRNLILDTLSVSSDKVGVERFIRINSDLLTADLKGNFQVTQTLEDLQRLVKEYRLNFAGDAAGTAAYYRRKINLTSPPYEIQYNILLKNSQPLWAFLYPGLYFSPNTRLDGRFTVDRTSLLTLNGQVDTLKLDNYSFYSNTIDLNTSKFINNPDVLASLVIASARQDLGPLAPTERLEAEASWDVNHIDFTSSLRQVNSSNRADVNGILTFKGDAIDFELKRSRFRLLDSTWRISPDNLIRIVGPNVLFRDFAITNQNQLISLNGSVSPDTTQELRVETRNFLLQTLNPLLATRLSGTANGFVRLRDLYGLKLLDGSVTIDSLKYNDYLIGNVVNRSLLDRSNRVNIDTRIQRGGRDVLAITGTYDPRISAESPLDLEASLNGTDLQLLQPFSKELISNLGGTAVGTVRITGKPRVPLLNGVVEIDNGKLKFDYLNADLAFEDQILFEGHEIRARSLSVTDPDGNRATLRGGVYFPDYKYVQLDLSADMRNFRILNTTAKDNDLFYGRANVTGKASIFGPLNNLTINADVTSNRGTRMFIPLDQAKSVTEENVIHFINRRGSGHPANQDTARRAEEPQIDLSGIKMAFNFTLTPDAYCEIQLDRQTGDIIKANGSGQIAMRIDTKGDFSMTGAYEIEKGEYTFTFENVINKRFNILPDSRITWTGDPYEALVDVKTSYTQYASLSPLMLSQSGTTSPDQLRRFPVDLLIDLRGRLLSPEISYNLKIREYPQQPLFQQAVTAFESRLRSNDQELGRQVSSVLLFGQLLPPDGISADNSTANVGSRVTNSLSELLSNQLSRLASTLNQNLDVGVSLNGLDQNIVNNLQVRFSYRFSDRFRISRDGGFTYGQNQTNVASLLGEWTLEYWLAPDGQLRLKMYNRNQLNQFGQFGQFATGTLTTAGGMSIQYTRSFNHLFGTAPSPAPGFVVPKLVPAAPVEEKKPVTTAPESTTQVDSNRR